MNKQDHFLNSFSQLAMIPYLLGQKQIQVNLSNYVAWLDLISPSGKPLRTIDMNFTGLVAPALTVVPTSPESSDESVTPEEIAANEDASSLKLTVMNADDDLTNINGIGPGIADKLNKRGITTFAQVAAWTESDVERLEEEIIRFTGRIKREDWIGQAKALVNLQ